MDGDVSEDWLIGRRIPILCVCCAMFLFFLLFSLFSCNQIYEREVYQTNKKSVKSGEKKDHLFERVKPKNSKSPKSYKKRPLGKKKKRARLCVHLPTRTPRAAQT